MKVKLQLSIDELIALSKLLNKLYNIPFTQLEKEQKVAVSIGLKLADKFDKKSKTILKKASLFDQKKKISFTLDFYEAWATKKICIELYSWAENDYQKLNLDTITAKLDRTV